jgi:hypothetical protein
MAAGDAAFLFTFTERFGPSVARLVRRMLGDMGRHDVLRAVDEVEALTLDACFVIYERAAGWRPGSALPWNWARLAIRAEVSRGVGHRLARTDAGADHGDRAPAGADLGRGGGEGHLGVDDWAALVRLDPRVAALAEVIRSVGSPRDQRVFVQYQLQKHLGDPSPAHVVAAEFGLTPANVRQIDRRMRVKLRARLAAGPRAELLQEVRWFAA